MLSMMNAVRTAEYSAAYASEGSILHGKKVATRPVKKCTTLTNIRRVFKLAFQSLISSLSNIAALWLYISQAVVGVVEGGGAVVSTAGPLVGIPSRLAGVVSGSSELIGRVPGC
jgi:hypothetical protein